VHGTLKTVFVNGVKEGTRRSTFVSGCFRVHQ